jgi:nucleoside-diphosphate-sugar epimerase
MMVKSAVLDKKIKLLNPKLRRPILDIDDLILGIEKIIESKHDLRGYYNMSSFNGTVEEYAQIVSDLTSSAIEIVDESSFSNILGGKVGNALDFSINSNKFKNTFNFKFNGGPTSITNSLTNVIENVKKSKRASGKNYE